ncbi:hypothetical protein GCM10007425_13510 [Lysinibacillus alkalisoli]|uniref:Uncharacterized protein n=1 Tax=Lysinibacillus alkalisoli TaxID=1911548 RepID=A0A917G3R0_9BACI|nr:hypothetical protein [Lysinibacillus alkalisoli]GGG20402.1 hypothetical protein GCM10007425_13510 [Lysinibacillus alkalisoli]
MTFLAEACFFTVSLVGVHPAIVNKTIQTKNSMIIRRTKYSMRINQLPFSIIMLIEMAQEIHPFFAFCRKKRFMKGKKRKNER